LELLGSVGRHTFCFHWENDEGKASNGSRAEMMMAALRYVLEAIFNLNKLGRI
jgi:hypothetical protein